MALPAKILWEKIQKELQGKSNYERTIILKNHLKDWHQEWKGPYRELKERLLRLLGKLEATESVKSSRGQKDFFHIKRQGDAQICFIGLTNSGKSAVVSTLTSAHTDVADYPFTTQLPIPGMLEYQGASIEIIDTPAIVSEMSKGKGVGRKLLQLLNITDALGIIIDLSKDPIKQMNIILEELISFNITTIPKPLGTILHSKGKGGIKFIGQPISKEEQISACNILMENGISHSEIVIRNQFSLDELLAQIKHEQLLPTIIIANKNDFIGAKKRIIEIQESFNEYIIIDINFLDEMNFDKLKDKILTILGLINVFLLDKPTEEAKRTPLSIPHSSSISEIIEKLFSHNKNQLKSAKIWGKSVKYPGQNVSMTHLVEEGDLIYLQDL